MKASIWAATAEGIIGVDGKIPWHYAGDFKRFKHVTSGAAVVMGRRTWESIGKPLKGRLNVVVTSAKVADWMAAVDDLWFTDSIDNALRAAAEHGRKDVFFIGGRSIYEAAMPYVDIIDETRVPDKLPNTTFDLSVTTVGAVDESVFECGPWLDHEDEPALKRRVWLRRGVELPYEDASNRRLAELGYLRRST